MSSGRYSRRRYGTGAIGPLARALDLEARARGLEPDVPRVTIRGLLVGYAFCIAWAPSAYMAGIGLAGRASNRSFDSLALAIVIGFGAVTAFAILCSLLMSVAFTAPLVDMAAVIERIAAKGEVADAGRVPRQQRDEIGGLVDLTNAMIARLGRTERERETARAKLEELAHSLEQRVAEIRGTLERETRDRARVQTELDLARRIQTSILPRQTRVDGLDISAAMVTATEVGGDYYDILPRRGGGWIGIGDVSGHGVGAGLIMLMLQSATAALVDTFPDASARELVVAVDRILFENIRRRLQVDDYVTFMLLRYEAGRIRFAGAHEDVVVYRAATGRCERRETNGTWIGVSGKIDSVTVENELELAPGDVLVPYTDGITEARRDGREQYGLDRLCRAVEALAKDTPVDAIRARVLDEVLAWCGAPQDDMSLIVARQV